MADKNKKSVGDRVKNSISKMDNMVPRFRGEKESTLFGTAVDNNDGDTEVDHEEFEELYKRNPIAFRGIQKFSQDPVQSGFRVVDEADSDDLTEFEEEFSRVQDDIDLKQHLIKLLKYSFLYGSAEMAYGLVQNGDVQPSDPVNSSSVQGIDYINIVKEPFVEAYELNRDPMSERFGELEAVEVNIDTEDIDGDQVTLAGSETDTRRIHYSRFQHFKAFEVDEHPTGFGLLHPAYNSLKTFENVLFGAGQSFFYAGTGFPHFEVEGMDEDEFENFKAELGDNILEEPYFASEKGKIDVEFKGNEGSVLDPTNYFEPLWNILGSTFGGSKQVLFGTEAGELKGSEVNKEEYYGDIESFQEEYLTPFVRRFVQRMIDYGVVPEPDGEGFNIEWNDLYSKSEEVQSEINNNKSKAFSRYKKAGLSNKEAAELADVDLEVIENPDEVGTAEGNPEDPGGRDPEEEQEANAEDEAVTDEDGDEETPMHVHNDRMRAVNDVLNAFEDTEFESDKYFELGDDESRTDYDLSEPRTWGKDLYRVYRDMRDDLVNMHHGLIDDVVELVDKSSLSEDAVEDADNGRLVKAQFDTAFQRRLDEFTQQAKDRTRKGMKASFMLGAKSGARDLNLTPDEIFNKQRRQVVDNLADKYMSPAYANTTDEVAEKINAAVEQYYAEKDQGIDDLKRNIRDVAGGDKSLDYRYERIARTETARLRNTGYVTEAKRQGFQRFDWTGPVDNRKCAECLGIINNNPYTYEALIAATSGLVPHPNCRDTAVVTEEEILAGDSSGEEDNEEDN